MKILPLIHPPICGYMMFGYHLAITLQHDITMPWYMSHFIQLKYKNDEILFLDGTSEFNHWLKNSLSFEKNELTLFNLNILDVIMNAIDNDYYVETFVDEYYLSNMRLYGVHYNHRLLINGYDRKKKLLYISGYKQNHEYGETSCTFEEFELGFEEGIGKTTFFKFNPAEAYPFHLEKIINKIRQYLLLDVCEDAELLGVNVYDKLILFLNKHSKGLFDIRGIHILWEHKKCMLDRISYLLKNKYIESEEIVSDYKEVVDMLTTVRTNALKYILLQDQYRHIVEGLPNMLKTIKIRETNILLKLLMELERYECAQKYGNDMHKIIKKSPVKDCGTINILGLIDETCLLTEITILSEKTELALGETTKIKVIGNDINGEVVDLTRYCNFESSAPLKVRVYENGIVSGLEVGNSQIRIILSIDSIVYTEEVDFFVNETYIPPVAIDKVCYYMGDEIFLTENVNSIHHVSLLNDDVIELKNTTILAKNEGLGKLSVKSQMNGVIFSDFNIIVLGRKDLKNVNNTKTWGNNSKIFLSETTDKSVQIVGTGSRIWRSNDDAAMYCTDKEITDNFSVSCDFMELISIDDKLNNDIGLMIRRDDKNTSPHISLMVRNQTVILHYRSSEGGNSKVLRDVRFTAVIPFSLKIIKSGNVYTSYYKSCNENENWIEIYRLVLELGQPTLAGVVICSGSRTTPTYTTIKNLYAELLSDTNMQTIKIE